MRPERAGELQLYGGGGRLLASAAGLWTRLVIAIILMRPSLARLLPLLAAHTHLQPPGGTSPYELAARLELAAPHVASSNRTRLLQALAKSELAHEALLAKCGHSVDDSVNRLKSRRERTPVVALPPPAPPSRADAFFGKSLPCRGLPVRAHDDVADAALWVAHDRVGRMLRCQSDAVLARLERADAAIHLVGRRQAVSDLPEFRHLQGRRGDYAEEALKDPRRVFRYGLWAERSEDGRSFRLPLLSAESLTIDERTRGMGGVQASCGEENLLGVDADPRYAGRDILSHEFAHCLMGFGFPRAARDAIQAQYDQSVGRDGLWRRPDGSKAYAATNADEYFAELSMWYWGSSGEFVDRHRRLPPPGPYGLFTYDPNGFAMIGSIFEGSHPSLRGDDVGPPPVRVRAVEAAAASDGNGTREVHVDFRAGEHAVSLAWIDEDGERHGYGTLEARTRRMQQTFAGHVWEVASEDGGDDGDGGGDGDGDGGGGVVEVERRRYRASCHEAQFVDVGEDLPSAYKPE